MLLRVKVADWDLKFTRSYVVARLLALGLAQNTDSGVNIYGDYVQIDDIHKHLQTIKELQQELQGSIMIQIG